MFNMLESIFMLLRGRVFNLSDEMILANDPEGYIPLSFESILAEIDLELIDITEAEWLLNCKYKPTDELRVTKFFLHTQFDPNKPTIIFHHTVGEIDYSVSMQILIGQRFLKEYNVFSIKAQNHDSKESITEHAFDSFLHHQQTFAGSVLAVEEIVKYHNSISDKPIFVIGASMGGIVGSLHAFHFGSATAYFPLVAYPNAGEVSLGEGYKDIVQDWEHKKNNKDYLESYNIKPEKTRELLGRIYPILGEKDLIIPFNKAAEFWKDFEVVSFPYGHFTPPIKALEIREYIRSKMEEF